MKKTTLVILMMVMAIALGRSLSEQTATRADQGSTGKGKGSAVKGELIVRVKPGAGKSERDRALSAAGARVKKDFSSLVPGLVKVELPKNAVQSAAINALRNNPVFSYVEENLIYETTDVPNDPNFSSLYGLNNTGQTGGLTDADIDAPEAWNTTKGSSEVVVGVIDTGIDYRHPDLQANLWTNPGEIPDNGLDDDNNGVIDDVYGFNAITGTGDPLDDNMHGTHVSGTIGARGDNGIGVVGVNWNVKLMGLKFLSASGFGSLTDAIEAINYAVMMRNRGVNIRVLSNSWGGGGFSQALLDAINAANDAGLLFVAAAGNSSRDTDISPNYPSCYNAANIISVAATNNTDSLANFSNFGSTTVDLGAPGVDTLSTTPGNSYSFLSGTSMATPHVSGVAALLLSVNPNLTVAELKDAILQGADPVSALQFRCVTGGRLNAARALTFVGPPITDFNISATPATKTINQGQSASYNISTSAVADFTGAVTFSATANPVFTGGSFSFAPDTVDVGGGSVLTVTTTTNTPAGIYLVNIRGVSGEKVRNRQVTLTVDPVGTVELTYNSNDDALIPDGNSTGITSTIDVPASLKLFSLSVRVDITHTYIGDLEVTLFSPSGAGIILHNQDGGATEDLHRTYNVIIFNNQSSLGQWRLRVRDLYSIDGGTLDHWGFTVKGVEVPCSPYSLSPSTLPNGTAGTSYNQTITASGGIAPYRFSVSEGRLPTGLTISADGTISGKPSSGGNFAFTVAAFDDNGCLARQSYTINIPTPPFPFITGLSPDTGPIGADVLISGSNFTTATAVTFNGLSSVFNVVSDSSIVANVPLGATTGPVRVTTAGGTATSFGSFIVAAAGPPVINGFTPTAGQAGTRVTISGSNFSNTTAVKFNNVSASFSVILGGSIQCTVPDGATTGRISVTTPLGTAVSANSFGIMPSLDSFTPTSGPAGTEVTITGSGFVGITSVKFRGVSASFTILSPTSIRAIVPPDAISGLISITNGSGESFSLSSFGVHVKINSFTPTGGSSGTEVTITGSGLFGATAVLFNGTAASYTILSATTIKATVPELATTGTIQVAGSNNSSTSSIAFKILPRITGFSPPVAIAGERITISGTDLKKVTAVKFGTVAATSFTIDSDTQIIATLPATAITGKISVSTPDGTSTSATDLIVIKPATVSSFSPVSAPIGTSVTINGTNLSSVTEVLFNGTTAGVPTIISATSIKATVPAGATTGKISVVNRAGTATSAGIFKVLPKITAFNPKLGIAGESVKITGTNFGNSPTVKFGTAVATVTSVLPNEITANIPPTAITGKISVATADGTSTSATDFIVIKPPTIGSFTLTGSVGTLVTINGTNLSSVTEVLFNGTSAGAPTVVSATSIKATVPASATTGKISVTNRAGTATSTAIFKVLPKITGFAPSSAIAGESITITGTNLRGATAVRFGSIAASQFTVDSDTQITVTVPATAATGRISVTTPDGTATSAVNLIVIKPPSAFTFTPASGKVATVVTISSSNASTVTSVTFGGVSITDPITIVSATSIRVKVPEGAITGKIAITNRAGTATSTSSFTVLP